MCIELLPILAAKFKVKWVMVKIHEGHHADYLREMALRFGFVYQDRVDEMEFWRKDIV